MIKKLCSLLVTMVVITFISSCAITGSKVKVEEKIVVRKDTVYIIKRVPYGYVKEGSSYIIDDPKELLWVSDSLIKNSSKMARLGDFEKAHILATISVDLLESSEKSILLDSLLNESQFYTTLGRIYIDEMPVDYLDSIPPTLTSAISRYQLNKISATLDTSDLDTSLIPKICDDGVHYNIPITHNKRVQKALVTLLSKRYRKRMNRLLQRAYYYRPFMNEIYEKAKLPTDLTFLPLLESAFNPKAYSPAHASGLWQFISSTGAMYNLRNNYWVDERRDPIKSTIASSQYFDRLYGMFDDWYLALASYNCGEGRVRRTLKKSGESSYWDIELPKETMNYVPLYIAYQIIAKNPHCFGFDVDTTAEIYDFDTVQVSDCIDMNKIADGIGVPLKELNSINPHIIKWCTPPDMNNITLYIPKGKRDAYKKFYKTLRPGDKVKWYRYKIRPGDNLGAIAVRFDISVSSIKSVNRMKSSRIVAGRSIFIPISATTTREEYKEMLKQIDAENGGAPRKEFIIKKKISHKVKSGESLSFISKEYEVSISDIIKWNAIKSANSVKIGQILLLYPYGKPSKEDIPKKKIETLKRGKKRLYIVNSGESYYSIASMLGVSVSDLVKWNGQTLSNAKIFPNDTLKYYGGVAKSKISKPRRKVDLKRYKVKSGDSLDKISRYFSVSKKDIISLNKLSSKSILKKGMILLIPKTSSHKKEVHFKEYTIERGDNLWSISSKFKISISAICSASNITRETRLMPGDKLSIPVEVKITKAPKSKYKRYKIKRGDTFWSISQKIGLSVDELCKINNIKKTDAIYPGSSLKIPK